MTEVPDQTKRLMTVLAEQTRNEEREWEKGSSDTEFVFVHDAGSLIISSVDGDGVAPYALQILDPAGRTVESYNTNLVGDVGYFRALYEAAQKSSIKASPVVTSLLEQIEREGDIPF